MTIATINRPTAGSCYFYFTKALYEGRFCRGLKLSG